MVATFYAGSFSYYRRRALAVPPLSRAQEAALGRAYRDGDARAGQQLVEASLRTVIAIAWEYRRWNTPIEDLVQQGNIGLLKAAARFDPSRDNHLRSYASYWIRAEIREYVVRGYRMVRLGTTRTERRAIRAFRTSEVRNVDELVEKSGMPRARCERLWPLLTRGDAVADGPDGSAAPLPCDGPTHDPEQLASDAEQDCQRRAMVGQALSGLSKREQWIVRARLMSDEPQTLEAIGQQLGVSRERIRQLEKRAKEKMRTALSPLVA